MKSEKKISVNEKLSPLVREITWANNLIIMSRAKSVEAREFYLLPGAVGYEI